MMRHRPVCEYIRAIGATVLRLDPQRRDADSAAKRCRPSALALAVVLLLCLGAAAGVRVRMPAGAGLFYPADSAQLGAAVEQYLNKVTPPDIPGRYLGCIAPHSAFPYSGQVAAQAFRPLKQGQYDRVIVLAPSHFADFEHCSLPAVQFFRTPLGDVLLDGAAMRELQLCPLIDVRSVTYARTVRFKDGSKRTPLHETEHSIEILLPFLQARLGQFKLVPVLVGSYLDYHGKLDTQALDATAEALREIIDDRTFIVASTDLTHYGARHGFRPFGSNAESGIADLDLDLLDLLLKRNLSGLQVYLDASGIPICGENVIELFMRLLPRGTQAVLLDYTTSGSVTGSYDNSVSYASLAYFHPELAPAQSRMSPLYAPEPLPSLTEVAAPAPEGPPAAEAAAPPAGPKRPEPRADKKPEEDKKERRGLLFWRKKADKP